MSFAWHGCILGQLRAKVEKYLLADSTLRRLCGPLGPDGLAEATAAEEPPATRNRPRGTAPIFARPMHTC